METVVLVMMIMVCFNYILKQTYRKVSFVALSSVICALFVGLMWQYAIEQSKSQISTWLADSALMLDTAVVLSVEIIIQISFCIMAVNLSAEGQMPKWKIVLYRILRWFPGVLIFPVLFSALVYAIFSFPGVDFRLTAWIMAAATVFLIPCGAWLFRKAVPEKDLRLELLFILNILTALFGIVGTVNGQTAVEGFSEVDWSASAGIALITLAGAACGLAWYAVRLKKKNGNN